MGEAKKKKDKKKESKGDAVDVSQLPLPPGWEKKYSREKDKAYYIDHNTRETYWKHPLDPKFKRKKPKEEDADDNALNGKSSTVGESAATPGSTEMKGGASSEEKKSEQKTDDNGMATSKEAAGAETLSIVEASPSVEEKKGEKDEQAPDTELSEVDGGKETGESDLGEKPPSAGLSAEELSRLQETATVVAEEEERQKEAEAQKLLKEAEEQERLRIEAEAEAEAFREAQALAKRVEEDKIEKAGKLEHAESLAKEISEKVAVASADGNGEEGNDDGAQKEAEIPQQHQQQELKQEIGDVDEAEMDLIAEEEEEKGIFSDEDSVQEAYVEAPLPCPYNPSAVPTKKRKDVLKHRAKHSLSSVASDAKQKETDGKGGSSLSISRHMIMDVPSPLSSKHEEPLSYTDASLIDALMTGDKPVLPQDSFASQTLHDDEQAVRRMQVNTNSMLSAANKLKPRALEKVDKTNIYGACTELQVLSNDIKPYMYPEEARTPPSCIKCRNSFNKMTRLKHHCYSCGEMYCHKCANNFWQMDIRESVESEETDNGYKKPVRVCDYCINHLCGGDLNSFLRYLGVARMPEAKPAAREAALHAILKSVEWEIQIPLEEKGSGKNVNIVDSAYKGLYTVAVQIGGWETFWRCLLHNLSSKNSGEIRDYTCKVVISIFNRLDSIDTARCFYLQDGVRLLGKCLIDPVCKVSSAFALYTVMEAFPLGPLQLSGLGGKEGVLVLTHIVNNLRDPDILPAFRTLLLTTVGLLIGADGETSQNADALDGLVEAGYHSAMIEYTKGDEKHHKIALEGLGRLLRRLGDSPKHMIVITDLLEGGIIDSTAGYLNGLEWGSLLEEKSYNQILGSENFHSLAFMEILSEAFDAHSHLLRKRLLEEGQPSLRVYDQVATILTILVTDPTEYRTSNEGWQILASSCLSVALNVMSFEDFDKFVPYNDNLPMIESCLKMLLMPFETDMYLIHQAVAVLCHYGYDLTFAHTLTLFPGSAITITKTCIEIITSSMSTLRSNTHAIHGSGAGDGDERQPSAIRRLSLTSKLQKTSRRYNPSDVMAFSLLSGMLYTTYTAKALTMQASSPSLSTSQNTGATGAGAANASQQPYSLADDFFEIYDAILEEEAIDEAIRHYLQYILASLDTGAASKLQASAGGAAGTGGEGEGASLKLQFPKVDEAASEGFVEGVPVLQFIHTLASCRGRIRVVDKFLHGLTESGTLSLLLKLLEASFGAKEYTILENVLWSLGSLTGTPGFFAWEEVTLENIYLTLLAGGVAGSSASSASESSSVSSSDYGDEGTNTRSPFRSNVGTEQHSVSAYEKALLLFARQRASMDTHAAHLYLQESLRVDNEDEMREILASIEEIQTSVRAIITKQGAILTPSLACHLGTPVMVAALRVMQGVLRDPDAAIAERGRAVCIKALLRFTSHISCNTTTAIIALDVLDVLTAHPEVWSAKGLVKYSDALNNACNDICTFLDEDISIIDPTVLMKAMEAVAEMASLKVCHDTICAHLLPLMQQIANLYPGNVLLEDECVNTQSMFRSMLRVVAKLGKNEAVASWLQGVTPILLKVLPTAEETLLTDEYIPELQATCMKPSGTDVYYSSRILVALLTAVGDAIETHEPNLRHSLVHPSITTTGQGIIGHIFDQIQIELPQDTSSSFTGAKEPFLQRNSLQPSNDWQPEEFSQELVLCVRILYLVAGAHFEPTASDNYLADKKVGPVLLPAASLRLAFNSSLQDEGGGDSESMDAGAGTGTGGMCRRSYLVYRLLLRMWARGDEATSLKALTILARAGGGYEYMTHPQRLARDMSQLHRHREVLTTAPWRQLLADRQVYIIFELLERAGQMAAGCALCIGLGVGEGEKEQEKRKEAGLELLTRTGLVLSTSTSQGTSSHNLGSIDINSNRMADLPGRIVRYEGNEETLYLRASLEESVGPPGGIPTDGSGSTLGPKYKVPGALDPSSTFTVQSIACIALRHIVHELRFLLPHIKEDAAMIGEGSAEDKDNKDEDEDEENAAGDATATIIATSSSELVRDKHFPAMRAAIIGLCKGRKFMDVVQEMAPTVIQACFLFQDITRWPDVLLRYSSVQAVTSLYDCMLTSTGNSLAGATGMAKKSHFTMLSVLCLWVARSHHHPKLRHLLLVQLDRATVCTNLATVLNFHVRALQEGAHEEDPLPSAPALCTYTNMSTSLCVVHQVLEIFRLFFDHEEGDDDDDDDDDKEEEEQDHHSVRARTGQAIVRALAVVLAVEQQRLAGESVYRYESVPHFSSSHVDTAMQMLDNIAANGARSASAGSEGGLLEQDQDQEQEQEQEPLELVDIYPGTPGYPALPVAVRAANPGSKPAFPVSEPHLRGSVSSMVEVASPEAQQRAKEDGLKNGPLSPWIKSPISAGAGAGRGVDGGDGDDDDDEDDDEADGSADSDSDGIWAVDEAHHADLIEVDISDSMHRFWDLMVALTESPTFIEALLPSTVCGDDPKFGGKGEPLRILEMTVIMELLRVGTGIARDRRRHSEDSHLHLIEYCVRVLKNVFLHRPMELIRLLLTSGQDLRASATGDAYAEEEGMYSCEDTYSDDTEEYVALIIRYITHVYASLRHIPGGHGDRYEATAFELVTILSTLSANSIPLCTAILSSTAMGSDSGSGAGAGAGEEMTSHDYADGADGTGGSPQTPFEKGAFLVCCATRIVEGCALAKSVRARKRMQVAAERIFALWRARKEQREKDRAKAGARALSALLQPQAEAEMEEEEKKSPDAAGGGLKELITTTASPEATRSGDDGGDGEESFSPSISRAPAPTDTPQSKWQGQGQGQGGNESEFREDGAERETEADKHRDTDTEDLEREHREEGEDEVAHMDTWLSLLANLCRTRHGRVDILYYCHSIFDAFLPLLLPMNSGGGRREGGVPTTELTACGAGVHFPGFYLRISRLRAPNSPLHRTKASFIQLLASVCPACHGAQGVATPTPLALAVRSPGAAAAAADIAGGSPHPQLSSVGFQLHSGEQLTATLCATHMIPHFLSILHAAIACLGPEQRDLRLVTMALSVATQMSGLPSTQELLMHPSTLQTLCDLLPRVVAMAPGAKDLVSAAGSPSGSRMHLAPAGGAHATLALQATHLCVRLLNSILIKRGTPAAMLPFPLVKLLLLLALTTAARDRDRNKTAPAGGGRKEKDRGTSTPLEVVWAPVITHVVEIVHLLGLDLHNKHTLSRICAAPWGASANGGGSSSPTPALGLSLPLLRPLPLSTTRKTINSALIMVQVQGLNAYLQPCERPAAVPALYQPSYC